MITIASAALDGRTDEQIGILSVMRIARVWARSVSRRCERRWRSCRRGSIAMDHPSSEWFSRARTYSWQRTTSCPRTDEENPMSDETAKTPADHLADTLAQLKEMRHYSKSNVEHLTASWILFEGELKQTARIEELMNRQSEFHDALESTIEALESQLKGMSEEESEA
jgi:hypothetical protein